jgi:anaphase-promoting complex subunit 2
MHGHGMASLRVTFEDGRQASLVVSPLQAAIVLRFADRPRWTVKELQSDLEVDDEAALRRRLVLLAHQDVIRATDGKASTYEAIERAEDVDSSGGVVDEAMGDADSGGGDDAGREEGAEMAVYLTYVIAMLRNLKTLPLERIHNMLQMFCKTPAYDKTQAQLAAFLAHLVAEEKIALHAGMYRVRD